MRKTRTIAAIAGTAGLVFLALSSQPAATQEPDDQGFELHRAVPYVTRGEEELLADIYVPEAEGPLPAVLMVHGGAWTTGNRQMMFLHASRLVGRGYVVMSIDYRLAPEHPFPAQIEDCQEAVRWLRTHAEEYKVDPECIAGYGYSAGGHLVCLLGMMDTPTELPPGVEAAESEEDGEEAAAETLAESDEAAEVSTRLQAVVAGGAPCDFTRIPEDSEVLAYWLGGSREQVPDTYRQASPALFASEGDPPVFFFHGEKDLLVWRESPRSLQRRLLRLGITSPMHLVPAAGHMGAFFDEGAVEAAGDFLDEVLLGIPSEEAAPAESEDPPAAAAADEAEPATAD